MAHPILTRELDYNRAEQEIGLSAYERTFVERNRKYHAGDHWQGGDGYIGPRPADDGSGNAQVLWALLERAFVSKNVVKEMDDRLKNAITGQEPDWNATVRRPRKKVPKKVPDPAFVPPPDNPTKAAPMIDDPKGLTVDDPLLPEEEALIDEAMSALYILWSSGKPLEELAGLLERRLWGGRSYVSQFVPPKFRNKDGFAKMASDFNEAIKRIHFRSPDICDAVKLVDPVTMDETTLLRYERGQEKVIEICFVDDDGLTFVGTLTKSGGEQNIVGEIAPARQLGFEPLQLPSSPPEVVAAYEQANPLPFVDLSSGLQLNGHLTTFELFGDPFITPQITSSNSLVNLSLTLAGHILVDSAFSELALTNVELETEKVPDARAEGGYREVPKALKRGGTVVHNFVGVQSIGKDGATVYATPGVHKFDPTPITVCKDGKELGYRNCLEEGHQLHALIAGDAAPSGESRIQALADFVMNALPYKRAIDGAGVWMLETALAWAAELAGKPGYFNSLRINFDCKIYVGKLTPEERSALIAEVEARLRSRETAMVMLGINDPAAEKALIDEEEKERTPAPLAPGALPPGQLPPGTNPGNGNPRPGTLPANLPPNNSGGQGRTGANA